MSFKSCLEELTTNQEILRLQACELCHHFYKFLKNSVLSRWVTANIVTHWATTPPPRQALYFFSISLPPSGLRWDCKNDRVTTPCFLFVPYGLHSSLFLDLVDEKYYFFSMARPFLIFISCLFGEDLQFVSILEFWRSLELLVYGNTKTSQHYAVLQEQFSS